MKRRLECSSNIFLKYDNHIAHLMINANKLSKIIIFSVLLFIIGETSIRVLEAISIDGKVGSLYNYIVMRENNWHLRPNITIVQPERYGDRYYVINQHGYRDKNRAKKKDASKKILFLGDSVTFGLSVNYEFTYCALLENALNKKKDSNLEVINLAMFGYSPINELLILKKIGFDFTPKLIVLQLYMNDFNVKQNNERHNKKQISFLQRIFILKEKIFGMSAILRRVRQTYNGALYHLFHHYKRKYLPELMNDEELKLKTEMFESYPDNQRISGFDEIESMALLSKRNHIDFIVMLTPNEVQLLESGNDLVNQRVNQFCKKRNIPFFDPLPIMRNAKKKLTLFNDGLHLSETGHKMVADWLTPLIENRELKTSME